MRAGSPKVLPRRLGLALAHVDPDGRYGHGISPERCFSPGSGSSRRGRNSGRARVRRSIFGRQAFSHFPRRTLKGEARGAALQGGPGPAGRPRSLLLRLLCHAVAPPLAGRAAPRPSLVSAGSPRPGPPRAATPLAHRPGPGRQARAGSHKRSADTHRLARTDSSLLRRRSV